MTNPATPQDAAREGDAESVPLTPVTPPDSAAPPDGPAPPPTANGQEADAARSGGAPEPAPADERAGADQVVAAPPYRPSYVFLVVVALITLAADLGTKWWAKDRLEPSKAMVFRKIEVIKDHLNLIFAKNHGGAWGILGDESEAIRRPFFLLISFAAIIFIVSLFRKLHPSQTALKWGLPFVLGGALGNLVDRIRYGFVVDFIQIRVTPTFVWPTFNVADIAIVVGVGLMAIDMFVPRRIQQAAGHNDGEKAPAGGR
jgi:signal peptidase II